MVCMCGFCLALVPLSLVLLLLRAITTWRRKSQNIPSVAFFHPFCNDGGGGERVLWCAISALQSKYGNKIQYVVYSGEHIEDEEIFANVKRHFDIQLAHPVEFVRIKSRSLLVAANYPRLTLLCQGLGSVVVAIECVLRFSADVVIDSTGYAFTLPVFALGGASKVACYVHYPTISTDMLKAVESATSAHNNDASIASSAWKTKAKSMYYRLFAKFYRYLGRSSSVTMVNSSWTGAHIAELWGGQLSHTDHKLERGKFLDVVYPPCNTLALQKLPLSPRQPKVISIAQFRPEKNHMLQLAAFALLLKQHKSLLLTVRLVLIGSVRHESDAARVEQLKKHAEKLKILNHVEFCVNAPFSDLRQHFATATVGLHTMWNEHFGIGVVELMASGVIPIAHRSGGPLMDIVKPIDGKQTGYLATTAEEYAEAMWNALDMTTEKLQEMQLSGRKQAALFSDQVFESRFVSCVGPLLEGLTD